MYQYWLSIPLTKEGGLPVKTQNKTFLSTWPNAICNLFVEGQQSATSAITETVCIYLCICVYAVPWLYSEHVRKVVLSQRLLQEATAVMTRSSQAMGTPNSMFTYILVCIVVTGLTIHNDSHMDVSSIKANLLILLLGHQQ